MRDGRVAGVVLAGGESSRMGRPKALLPLGGTHFLGTICERLRLAGVGPVIVVAGSAAEAIGEAGGLRDERLVVNPAPGRGQLSSLQVGVGALDGSEAAAICCLVDHPLVAVATYARLVDAWREHPGSIVRPILDGKRGHPIVLDRRFFDELLALPAEATMRAIVGRNLERSIDVPVDDPGIHRDFDTLEDYERLGQEAATHGPRTP